MTTTPRPGTIEILSRLIATLLVIQFLVGMYANIFLTFSSSTNPNPFAVIFNGPSLTLKTHVLLAAAIYITSLALLTVALFTRKRPIILLATAGFASIALAFASGIAFVYTTYTDQYYSYSMAVAFITALVLYGTFQRPEFQAPTENRTEKKGLMILQVIASAIIIFGGFALISFNPGSINLVLGIIVLLLGIIALFAGYTIWTQKTYSIFLARSIDLIITFYVIGQESYTILTATGAQTVIGSLVGTATSLGLLLGVILNLPRKP